MDGLVKGLYSIFVGGTAGQVWKKLGNGVYDMGWGDSIGGSKEANINWITPFKPKLDSGKLILGRMYGISSNSNEFDLSYLGATSSIPSDTFTATATDVINWDGLSLQEVSITQFEITSPDYPIGAISNQVNTVGGDDFQNLELRSSIHHNTYWLNDWYSNNTYYYFKQDPTTWLDGSTVLIRPCKLYIENNTGITFNGYFINDVHTIIAIVASEDIFDKLSTNIQLTVMNTFSNTPTYSHAIVNSRILMIRCENIVEVNICIKVA